MITYSSIETLRSTLRTHKNSDQTIGFVATMGALHEGHATLMRQACAQNDIVVASIFVNPTQFNDTSDLDKYPRTMDADSELCEGIGVDYLFAPSVAEMYPTPLATTVDVPALSSGLIGKIRPGHFQGMASVVAKLLNIVGADKAYFGEKDYQQLAIIKRMVLDLNMPTHIVGIPTVREADGLAMSSRNTRLTPENRKVAPVIFQSIKAAQNSGLHKANDIIELVHKTIAAEPLATIKSIDIVDAVSLETASTIDHPAALLLNVQFGDIILIDQVTLSPSGAAQ